MNLTILTYNVFGMPWGLQSIESVLIWAFFKTDAEILCLQEVFSQSHRDAIEDICGRKDSQWTYYFPDCEPTWLSSLSSSFKCISGLCVLLKKQIHLLEPPVFQAFQATANLDRFVQKGFFHFRCEKEGVPFQFLTTHFQSDFTECKCRIRYQGIRNLQEIELFRYVKQLPNAFVIGDFNMNRFYHFTFVNLRREPTFHETGESLDHCLHLPDSPIQCQKSVYFHDVCLSDHIPVLFSLRLGQP